MQRSRSNRQKAERFGQFGELVAELVLRLNGFGISARRYKTPIGEIDLIARKGSTLVFAEVKTRRTDKGLDAAAEAINTKRITRAAQWYVSRNPELSNLTIRFDVIFLAPWSLPRHVRNAFIDEE